MMCRHASTPTHHVISAPWRLTLSGMPSLPASELQRAMGRRLQALREAHDLSQPALGELMGVAPNTISSHETGRTKIDIAALARLCEELQVSADYVILGAIGRLPADIAVRIQAATRADLGTPKRPGRPRKPRAPTVDDLPSWPADPPQRTVHQRQARFVTGRKSHPV